MLTEFANGSTQRSFSVDEALRTVCAQVKGGHFAMHAMHLTHLTHHGADRSNSLDEAMRTVTAANRGEQALAAAVMVQAAHGEGKPGGVQRWGSGVKSIEEPVNTVTSSGSGGQAVMAAWMEQANTGRVGHPMTAPVSTIVGRGTQQRFAAAYLVKFYSSGGQWQGCVEPMHTVPTKDRLGLVQVEHVCVDGLDEDLLARARRCAAFMHEYLPEHFPEPADLIIVGDYVLVDFTLRMLSPRELARAQGFPADYILDRGLFELADGTLEWRPVTKTDQVRLIGNSVCPDMAEALASANTVALRALYAGATA